MGLVLMKLIAFRPQDRADVEALLRNNETRLADVSDYLAEHAPDLLIRLGQVLSARSPGRCWTVLLRAEAPVREQARSPAPTRLAGGHGRDENDRYRQDSGLAPFAVWSEE